MSQQRDAYFFKDDIIIFEESNNQLNENIRNGVVVTVAPHVTKRAPCPRIGLAYVGPRFSLARTAVSFHTL